MLHSDRLLLRQWRESDLDALATLRNDVELQALLMARARPNSIEKVRSWLTDRSSRDDMVFFVIATRDGDNVLGYLQIANMDFASGVGELGVCVAPLAQGTGVAQEACRLVEPYLRQTFGIRKLTLRVLASNARAVTFYRRNGYREVGKLDRHFRIDDQYYDVLIMERFLDK